MKPTPILAAFGLITALTAGSALASDSLVKFDGGIGSQPLRAGNPPVSNAVAGVAPGGAPWVIKSLKADIKTDGKIRLKAEGILLGGTDNIGTRGGPRRMVASLFCRNAPVGTAPAGTLQTTPYNSEFVDLDANGDLDIGGSLTNTAGDTPPADCGNKIDNRPVLLLRTVNEPNPNATPPTTSAIAGSWFAAGILKD